MSTDWNLCPARTDLEGREEPGTGDATARTSCNHGARLLENNAKCKMQRNTGIDRVREVAGKRRQRQAPVTFVGPYRNILCIQWEIELFPTTAQRSIACHLALRAATVPDPGGGAQRGAKTSHGGRSQRRIWTSGCPVRRISCGDGCQHLEDP